MPRIGMGPSQIGGQYPPTGTHCSDDPGPTTRLFCGVGNHVDLRGLRAAGAVDRYFRIPAKTEGDLKRHRDRGHGSHSWNCWKAPRCHDAHLARQSNAARGSFLPRGKAVLRQPFLVGRSSTLYRPAYAGVGVLLREAR